MAEPSGTPTLGATLAGQSGVPIIPMGPIEDRSKDVISVTIAMVVPAVVIVAMRLWVRASIVGKLGADDWCITAAAVSQTLKFSRCLKADFDEDFFSGDGIDGYYVRATRRRKAHEGYSTAGHLFGVKVQLHLTGLCSALYDDGQSQYRNVSSTTGFDKDVPEHLFGIRCHYVGLFDSFDFFDYLSVPSD